MANVTFTLTRDDLTPALARMKKLGKDTTPVMLAMGNTFKSITEGNFNSAGAEYRPAPWPAKKDGTPSNLKKSGLLWHSFHLKVDRDTATLSNPTPYAAVHQFGSRNYKAGTVTGRTKTKYANPLFSGSWQNIMSGGKGIPPRPFFPVLAGKLTKMASEKIVAAGMRALQRLIAPGKP